MAGGTYDIVQTVFLLNMAANGASMIEASEKNLQSYLSASLSGGTDPLGGHFKGFFPLMNPKLAGGDWKVVWGPCVYSVDPFKLGNATNAMYVAYSAELKTYVVAIAATNAISAFDWIKEDAAVGATHQASWPFALPYEKHEHLPFLNLIPATSAGTALGVSDLLTRKSMQDPATGKHLETFLSDIKDKGASTLIFTGHSLAGALSPTLALRLYPEPGKSGWKTIRVLPTAGATPGNRRFANLFNAAYPKTAAPGVDPDYGYWNTDITNARDVVPHAWNQLGEVLHGKTKAGNVDSIFGVLKPGLADLLRGALDAARLHAAGGYYMNIDQIMTPAPSGTYDWIWDASTNSWSHPPVWRDVSFTDKNPAGEDDLGDIIMMTHVEQYYRLFKVEPPPRMATHLPKPPKPPLPPKA